MGKERLIAFTDAVLAIIMTILVLELEKPSAATWEAVWEIRMSFISYAISFFWLGAMWVNLHNQWHNAEKVTNGVVWWNVIMLFFSSLIPYVTSYAGTYFHNAFAQCLYAVVVMLLTISNIILCNELAHANSDDEHFFNSAHTLNKWMAADILMKIAGIIVAWLVYPPAAMISICVAAFIPTLKLVHLHKNTVTKGE